MAEIDTADTGKGRYEFNKDGEEALALPGCALGNSIIQVFGEARGYRSQSGVDARTRRAFYASSMEYTPEGRCAINGVDIYVGLFARLRAIFLAWHFDRVAPAGEHQFTVKPTPVPEVPDEMKREAVEKIVQQLLESGLPAEKAPEYMKTRIVAMKAAVMKDLYAQSTRAAGKMQTAMLDTMIEANYMVEYFNWWANFATYWGAIMEFPTVTETATIEWKKGKPKVVKKYPLGFKAISPLDFWITADGTNVNNARAVFVRARISFEEMWRMQEEAPVGPILDNLKAVLGIEQAEAQKDWMMTTSESEREFAENMTTFSSAPVSGTFEVLRAFIKISGKKLKEYGVTTAYRPAKEDIEDAQLYDTCAWMCNNRVVLLKPNSHPLGQRPLYLASYEAVTGTVYGRGLYDKVQNAERAACKAARDLVLNAEFASGVIAEVDSSRFVDGVVPTSLAPWALYRTETSPVGGSPTAIHMQSIPMAIAPLIALHQHYDEQAQKDSGLNYMMAGASEGASWMRTNVAVDTVQGNSTKVVNYRALLADQHCFLPMFRALWTYHMLYNPDETIKADASVDLKGLTSVATQDAQKARQIELLQYLPAVIGALRETGMALDGRFVATLVKSIMDSQGADTRHLADPEDQEMIQRLVGQSGAVTPDPVLDGRSAVPAGPDDQSRLPAG